MIWKKLTAKNFLSFEELTLELDNRGIVLVEGNNLTSSKFKSNGSGKSSLLEPIVYALYDTTSKGIKADEIVNNKVGKNTAVILEGVKGEDTYRIERYRKHSKYKNKVKLFINDKEVTEKSAAETNKVIQKIIGIDYNTFVNSIMFSQGNGAGRFAIATDKEKKEILENLVHLDVYAQAQSVAKERLKEKEDEIRAREQEKARLDWELERIDGLEKQDQENYENTKNMIIQEHKNIRATVEAMDTYVSQNYPTIEKIKERSEELQQQRDSANNFNVSAHILEAVNSCQKAISDKKGQLQQYEYQKSELVSKYKKLEKGTHCPVCGNELDAAHRSTEMAAIKEQLRSVLIAMQPLLAEIPPLEEKLKEATAKYQEEKAKQDTVTQNYQRIIQEINQCEQQIKQYYDTIQAYKTKINAAQSTVDRLSTIPEPKPRDKEREEVKKKIKAFRDEELKLQKERLKLENVVKVFSNSGVKSHVLDLITPFLNERANKHLATLSGPDMEVKFSTQTRNKDGSMSDKFDIQLINTMGGDNYKSNSEGEKKRADLAISLAIQDLVMGRGEPPTNFIVYDEVFDALDSVGSENVVTLLRERVNTVGTIFVITHNEHLKPLFDKVITVTKDKSGLSTVDGGVETT
ncbi:putative DNA repair exonuclease 2 [Bacillus phage BSP36]|nr:putative DNA repair exonuclease 2 [Bacillus phage BSP36]